MLVFAIAEEISGPAQCCRWEKIGGGYGLRFFRDGVPLSEPVVSTEPEGNQYALLDSAVSGGTFRGFLNDVLDRYGGRICLYLRAQTYRFPLPCPDGYGAPAEPVSDLREFVYSDSLCAYTRFDFAREPCVILTDGARSLREKYRVAENAGVPYLIAKPDILEIIKAPCDREP